VKEIEMETMEASEATLFDLLGRRWSLGGAVERVAFDAADRTVAFGLADGRIALAPFEDKESPLRRYRIAGDNGRASISPRRHPVPPVTQIAIGEGDLRLAAFGPEGFIAVGRSGQLTRLSGHGVATPMEGSSLGHAPILAPALRGGVLVAAGNRLEAHDDAGSRTLPRLPAPLTALALSRDGHWLASGDDAGLTIQAYGEDAATSDRCPELAGARHLAWSPDGRWLAASLSAGGIGLLRVDHGRAGRVARLPNYPAPVRCLAWDAQSQLLATSGAFRIVVWSVGQSEDPLDRPESLPTGQGGLVTVEAVAMHPKRALVAAGFANGALVVAQIGTRDELIVRLPAPGAIRDLCWSRDGQHLAFGTENGEAAIATLPPALFK
jgi:hypothetical protein